MTDLHALVKAAAKDKSIGLPSGNDSALNKRANAGKETLNMPGVVAWKDSVISGRGR